MWDEWRVMTLFEITGASETRQVMLLAAISRCRFELPCSLEFVTDRLIFTDWFNYVLHCLFLTIISLLL